MNSILDQIYNVLSTFFPEAMYNQPFFNFLINVFIFCFCCFIFSIFFIVPVYSLYKWIRRCAR